MSVFDDVAQTLGRPWKQEIPVGVMLIFIGLFAITVWWTFDSLHILGKLEAYANSLADGVSDAASTVVESVT